MMKVAEKELEHIERDAKRLSKRLINTEIKIERLKRGAAKYRSTGRQSLVEEAEKVLGMLDEEAEALNLYLDLCSDSREKLQFERDYLNSLLHMQAILIQMANEQGGCDFVRALLEPFEHYFRIIAERKR